MNQLSDNDEHSWSDGDTPTPMFATHGWSDTTLTSSLTGRSSFGSWEEDEGVCKLPEVTYSNTCVFILGMVRTMYKYQLLANS